MMTDRIYKCVSADPPWSENGGGGRGAQNHYPLMSEQDILDTLRRVLYGDLFANSIIDRHGGCHLWMWATDNYLPAALSIMAELGFRYVASWPWVKVEATGNKRAASPAVFDGHELANIGLQLGLGQYSRKCHEHLLFGVMGATMLPEPAVRPPSVIFAPRTEHSRKPDEARGLGQLGERATTYIGG